MNFDLRWQVRVAPYGKLFLGVIAALLSVGTTSAVSTDAAAGVKQPNIVFIMADDLGWGDVGFNGGAIPTPNLDGLAADGVRLTQHYVAPVCTPTRLGLMTGRYWTRFGVNGVSALRSMPYETETLPRALKRVGYETALFGKWHLGSKPEWGPNRYGFDHAYGSLGGGVTPYGHRYKKGPYSHTWHRNGELITEEGYVTDLLSNEAIKWIGDRGDAPFFAYVPFTAVHLPIREPEEWQNRVPEEVVEQLQKKFVECNPRLPRYAREDAATNERVARNYAACVMHLDHEVGRIVAALEAAGKRENTLIVFTSDNGGATGVENNDTRYPDDHCPDGAIPAGNRPLSGFKAELYEGGIRVATLVNWPGRLVPGSTEQPVHIVDWMPTLCALAGATGGEGLKWDGMNIWPSMAGEATDLVPRTFYTGYTQGDALRDGDWKLIVHKKTRRGPAKTELFDLSGDPSESLGLASQMPEKVKELEQKLALAKQSDGDATVSE